MLNKKTVQIRSLLNDSSIHASRAKITSRLNLEGSTVEFKDATINDFSLSTLLVDTINEKTTNSGCTVESVLLKDGLIDNVDLSAFKTDYDSKINQALLITSNPTFAGISITKFNNFLTAGFVKTASDGTISIDTSTYENPLTFSTGLTRTTNNIVVNATQLITNLSNLTSNGYVKTSGGDGTLSVSSGISTAEIDDNAVSFAKMQDIDEDTFFGRPSGVGTGDPQMVKIIAGTGIQTLYWVNAGGYDRLVIQTAQNLTTLGSPTFVGLNLSGLTASKAVFTDVSNNLTSTGIIAGTQGGTGINNGSKTITLGGNLTTSGAYNTTLTTTGTTNITLPTSGTLLTQNENITLSGDISGVGNTAITTTIGNNKITDSMIRQSSALSIIGNATNASSNVSDITAGSDFQVLRRSGTSLAFGAINLASSNAVTGVLPSANLGISASTGIAISGGGAISNSGVLSITGTTNQINASASTGNITLSTPQNIHTAASPTFQGLTLSNSGNTTFSTTSGNLTISPSNNITRINSGTFNLYDGGGSASVLINMSCNTGYSNYIYFRETAAGTVKGVIGHQSGIGLVLYQNGANRLVIPDSGRVGINTTIPDKQLEINHSTGDCLRLTYNDSNGSAANYTDFNVSSAGDLTITPSGGRCLIPSQPSFNSYVSGSDIANCTGDATTYTIIFNAEQHDIGGNFNTTTGTFVCPVAGRYSLNANVTVSGLLSGHSVGYVGLALNGSSALAGKHFNPYSISETGSRYCTIDISTIRQLSISDQITVVIQISGSTKVVDIIANSAYSYFCGQLLS